jgi:hypothetical protein
MTTPPNKPLPPPRKWNTNQYMITGIQQRPPNGPGFDDLTPGVDFIPSVHITANQEILNAAGHGLGLVRACVCPQQMRLIDVVRVIGSATDMVLRNKQGVEIHVWCHDGRVLVEHLEGHIALLREVLVNTLLDDAKRMIGLRWRIANEVFERRPYLGANKPIVNPTNTVSDRTLR